MAMLAALFPSTARSSQRISWNGYSSRASLHRNSCPAGTVLFSLNGIEISMMSRSTFLHPTMLSRSGAIIERVKLRSLSYKLISHLSANG